MDTIALLLPSTVETSVAASMGCKNGLDAGAHEEFHVENSRCGIPGVELREARGSREDGELDR